MNDLTTDRRKLLLGALASGLSLPLAFAASDVRAQAKPLTVGFTVWDLSIPFAVPFVAALKRTAAANNIDLKLVEAKFDASTQAQQISEFVASSPLPGRPATPEYHSSRAAASSRDFRMSVRTTCSSASRWDTSSRTHCRTVEPRGRTTSPSCAARRAARPIA